MHTLNRYVSVLWTWAILLIAVEMDSTLAGAACPGDLYYSAEQISDNREFYSRLKSSNIDDCVRKCYADDFCFSAHFTPKPAPEEADCRLSYIAAYNCTHKKLVSTSSDNTKPVTLQCLRCPQLGEFISPPPERQDLQQIQASASEHAAPAANFTSPIIDVAGSPGAPSTAVNTSSNDSVNGARSVPGTDTNAVSLTKASVLEEPNVHVTKSPIEQSVAPASASAITQSPIDVTSGAPSSGSGVQSSSSIASVGSSASASATPEQSTSAGSIVITTQQPNAHPVAASSSCVNLTFEIRSPDPSAAKTLNITEQLTVASAIECAQLCYTQNCTAVGFVPPQRKEAGSCLLAFDGSSETCRDDSHRASSYNGTEIVEFHCIRCEALASLESQPNVVTKGPVESSSKTVELTSVASSHSTGVSGSEASTSPELTTLSSAASINVESKQCPGQIQFSVSQPDVSANPTFTNFSESSSVADCARKCYEHGCSIAGYSPPLAGSDTNNGSCLLSFEAERCDDSKPRVTVHDTNVPVRIDCVKCGLEVLSQNALNAPISRRLNATEGISDKPDKPKSVPSVSSSSSKQCDFNKLTFIVKPPTSPGRFSNASPASGVHECANICYEKRCTKASYAEPALPNSFGSCLYSFDPVDECRNVENERVTGYHGAFPIDIFCVRCGQEAIVEAPSSVTKGGLVETIGSNVSTAVPPVDTASRNGSSSAPTETKQEQSAHAIVDPASSVTKTNQLPSNTTGLQSVTLSSILSTSAASSSNVSVGHKGEPKGCMVSFEVSDPAETKESVNFVNEILGLTFYECLQQCFYDGCFVANYVPDDGKSKSMCRESFSREICTTNHRVTVFKPTKSTWAHCLRCEDGIGKVTLPPATQSTSTTASSTTVSSTQSSTSSASSTSTSLSSALSSSVSASGSSSSATASSTLSSSATASSESSSSASGSTASASSSTVTASGASLSSTVSQTVTSPSSSNTLASHQSTPLIPLVTGGSVNSTVQFAPAIDNTATVKPAETDASAGASTAASVGLESDVLRCSGSLSYFVSPVKTDAADGVSTRSTVVTSADQCALECYAHNCTKATYHPVDFHISEFASQSGVVCSLSFEPTSCGNEDGHKRVSKYNSTKPTTISCIQCDDGRGLTESTAVASTAELQTTASTNVVSSTTGSSIGPGTVTVESSTESLPSTAHALSTSITRRCTETVTFGVSLAATPSTLNVTFTTVVRTAQACAAECFSHQCTMAVFDPTTYHASEFGSLQGAACTLTVGPDEDCVNVERVKSYSESNAISIRCVQCSEKSIEPAQVSVTKAPTEERIQSSTAASTTSIETTSNHQASTESVTASSTAGESSTTATAETSTSSYGSSVGSGEVISTSSGPVSSNYSCKGHLTFEVVGPDPDLSKAINFTEMVPGSSASECAQLCHQRNCNIAGFAPVSGNLSAACLLSFDGASVCGRNPTVTEYNDTKVIEIHCVKCNTLAETIIESIPAALTKAPSSITTPVPDKAKGFEQVRHCIGELSFVATSSPPFIQIAKVTSVSTASACAAECYAHGCTQAIFRTDNFHTSEIESLVGYPCSLSFEPHSCSADAHRVNESSSTEATLITCVECSLATPILMKSNESDSQNISTKANTTKEGSSLVSGSHANVTDIHDGGEFLLHQCSQPVAFVAVPVNESAGATNYSLASLAVSAQACAAECYAHGCSGAMFDPTPLANLTDLQYHGHATCFLYFENSDCGIVSPHQRVREATGRTLILCVECDAPAPAIEATPSTVTKIPTAVLVNETHSSSGETTTAATNKISSAHSDTESTATASTSIAQTSTVDVVGKKCAGIISFQVPFTLEATPIPVTSTLDAKSVADCAAICYRDSLCTAANFDISSNADGGSCHLSYDTVLQTCDASLPQITAFETTSNATSIRIRCLKCSVIDSGIAEVNHTSSSPAASSNATSGSDTANSSNRTNLSIDDVNAVTGKKPSSFHECLGQLEFQVLSPLSTAVADYRRDAHTKTVTECAAACFNVGCTSASFTPSSNPGQPGLCLMAYGPESCNVTTPYVTSYSGENTQLIQCIRCSGNLTTSVHIETTANETSTTSSTQLVTEQFPVETSTPTSVLASTTAGASERPGFINLSSLIDALPKFAPADLTTTSGAPATHSSTEATTGNLTAETETTTASPANISAHTSQVDSHGKKSSEEGCTTRVTFQISKADDALKTNFTEDHRVASAADCALLCYNRKNCEVAGYLPPPDGVKDGVCLLSTFQGQCLADQPEVVQVDKTVPITIHCIKCSPCSFKLSNAVPPLPQYDTQTDALNIVECAQNCARSNCTSAAFSARATRGNCLLARNGTDNCQAVAETRLELLGPVQIDCVRCGRS